MLLRYNFNFVSILCLLLSAVPINSKTQGNSKELIGEATGEAQTNFVGCFKDTEHGEFGYFKIFHFLTPEKCKAQCKKHYFGYAALQGQKCSCGDHYGKFGKVPMSNCKQIRCSGNQKEFCGGKSTNLLYSTGIKLGSKGLKALGCFHDDRESHDLGKDMKYFRFMRKEYCYQHCLKKKYRYFGMQSSWCMCGNTVGRFGQVPLKYCTYECFGDPDQSCGGRALNIVYTTVFHKSSLVKRMTYKGCFKDKMPRDLPDFRVSRTMNVRYCINFCQAKKYKYAALQGGIYCFCGDNYGRHGEAPKQDCRQFKCPAANLKHHHNFCGGKMRNRIFSTGVKIPKSPVSVGCFTLPQNNIRNVTKHVVKKFAFHRTFLCQQFCQSSVGSFSYFGMQQQNCHCLRNLERTIRVEDNICHAPCSGNHKTICGDNKHTSIYPLTNIAAEIAKNTTIHVKEQNSTSNKTSIPKAHPRLLFRCVDATTGVKLEQNVTRTEEYGDLCFTFNCIHHKTKFTFDKVQVDCKDKKHNRCVRPDNKGVKFQCQDGKNCICILINGVTRVEHEITNSLYNIAAKNNTSTVIKQP